MATRRLLIRPGAIGDVILSLPALLGAEATEVWTPAPLVPILKLTGIDRVRGISETGLDLVSLRGLEACPSLNEFDEIVSWYGANQPDFRAAVRGLPFRFLQALPPADTVLSASDFFLRQIGVPEGADPQLRLRIPKAEYAVIHPFSGSARKNWPLPHFQRLAELLDLEVRWTAGPEETLDGACRFDDLAKLAEFVAAARIYIGNDSGVTHLAAAVETPTVAIFGPTNPRVWAPRGTHVEVVMPPDRAALPALAPEQVLGAVRSLLSRR